jgi:glycosyltransferase involved in cell wall biosynthesis
MQALPRWDGKYASTSLNIAKELSKSRWVFFVDHPFTKKDVLFNSHQPDVVFRKPIWKSQANNAYAPFEDFPRLVVISPRPIPMFNFLPPSFLYQWAEAYANWSVWQSINSVLVQYNVEKFIYINSFDPVFSQVFTHLDIALKVYHCVDNIAGERYIARHGVRREKEFAAQADMVISTSPALAQKLSEFNPESVCVPNAADFSLFSKPATKEPVDMAGIIGPKVLYMGNIGLRIDYNLLENLALKHPKLQLVFVGPKDEREFKGQALESLSNVHFLGAKPYKELIEYVHACDVCMIPFEPNDLTRYIYPLKINEYLATGKPVVSSRFADLSDFESVIYTYTNSEDCYAAITRAIDENSKQKQKARREVASKNTWENRGLQFDRLINAAVHKKSTQIKHDTHFHSLRGAHV